MSDNIIQLFIILSEIFERKQNYGLNFNIEKKNIKREGYKSCMKYYKGD